MEDDEQKGKTYDPNQMSQYAKQINSGRPTREVFEEMMKTHSPKPPVAETPKKTTTEIRPTGLASRLRAAEAQRNSGGR